MERLLERAKQMQREQELVCKSHKSVSVYDEGILHGIERIVLLIEREMESNKSDNQEDI
jgi:hypothetical protein